jgi:hypothetical protein
MSGFQTSGLSFECFNAKLEYDTHGVFDIPNSLIVQFPNYQPVI